VPKVSVQIMPKVSVQTVPKVSIQTVPKVSVHRIRKQNHFLLQTLHNVNVLSHAGSIQPKYEQQIFRNTHFTTGLSSTWSFKAQVLRAL
jgi:hypothetical protein